MLHLQVMIKTLLSDLLINCDTVPSVECFSICILNSKQLWIKGISYHESCVTVAFTPSTIQSIANLNRSRRNLIFYGNAIHLFGSHVDLMAMSTIG